MKINESIKNLKVNLDSKIFASDKVIIVPHNNIDFDAIGSSIGLSLICKKLKKESYIVVNDPVYKMNYGCKIIVDDAKKDFNIIDKIRYKKIVSDNDLYVLSDVNKQYLISLADMINDPERTVIIDHHKTDDKTISASSMLIEPNMSSASEIVYYLLKEYKVKIPVNVANYLLAGILLDTNQFSKNTTSNTMDVTSELMKCGATMSKARSWFKEDFESDRRVQELVSQTSLIEHRIAIILANEDNEYSKEDLAKAADYCLKFGSDATFAIGNIGGDTIGISARSSETVDVGSVMKEFGGGGHNYSAAAQIENGNIEEIGKKLVKMFRPPYYIDN